MFTVIFQGFFTDPMVRLPQFYRTNCVHNSRAWMLLYAVVVVVCCCCCCCWWWWWWWWGGTLTWNDYHPCTEHAFYHSDNRRTYIYSFVSHITNLRFLLWIIHCRVVMLSPTLTVTISLSFRDSSRMWNTSWGTHTDQIPIILEATVWIRNIRKNPKQEEHIIFDLNTVLYASISNGLGLYFFNHNDTISNLRNLTLM